MVVGSSSGVSPESAGSVVVVGSSSGVSPESAGSVVSGSAVSGVSVAGVAAPPSSESVTSPPQAAATKAMVTTMASTKRSRMVMYVFLRPSVRTTK